MIFAGFDSKEYIAKKGRANLEESYKHMVLIGKYLRKVYNQKKITGYEYRILKSVEDIYDEDLDIDAINEINQGIFPCIWINITYKPDVLSESDLMAIEKELLLVSL
jgi:hypothetical protein